MRPKWLVLIALSLLALISGTAPVWALWAVNGVSVCTVAANQISPEIVSDGAGGTIIVWEDYRNTNYDIYAQRIDAAGNALWTVGGVGICTAANSQRNLRIASDGAGGAIIAWEDYRSGSSYDIYAQRVDGMGYTLWEQYGVAISTAAGSQRYPDILSDGAGGAIITWDDSRGGSSTDIYAQRVTASGSTLWMANGAAICWAAEDQLNPEIVSDGAGGAIIAWYDWRNGSDMDIFAQRVDAGGNALWAANGAAVCTAWNHQYPHAIASDGAGGAIIAWSDLRNGSDYDTYAQRIDASGNVLWTVNGVAICTAAQNQSGPQIIFDGAGGAIIIWEDWRSGMGDIYAQRVNSAGSALWAANGKAVCTHTNEQLHERLISDGAGGAIISWQDFRSNIELDVYAQRVDGAGNALWMINGVVISAAVDDQYNPAIASDGAGGAVIAWEDHRSGASLDIYAQQITARGKTGYLPAKIHSISDVPGDEGGKVNLTWDASVYDYLSGEITTYTIWRALDAPAALLMLADGASLLEDPAAPEASSHGPVLRLGSLNGQKYYWELIDSHEAYYLEAYSKAVATLFDSCGATSDYHYFQVIAHTSDPRVFFVSDPDSGYSVDNLAPCPPLCLAGEQSYVPEGLRLTWGPNVEPDLDCYHIYRGLTEDFVPAPGNRIGAPCDTLYFDSGWRWSSGYYYKVSALDVHGNESGYALLRPEDVTGSERQRTPTVSYLSQNYPNPFNPMTKIEFGLESPGCVSLRIYDAAGRLVRVLVEAERAAGRYGELWDGRDSAGRAAASGVYFYRLSAGTFRETKKMVLSR